MVILPILTTSLIHFSLEVGRMLRKLKGTTHVLHQRPRQSATLLEDKKLTPSIIFNVLHTVWCYIFGEPAGEMWSWSLMGVKGLSHHHWHWKLSNPPKCDVMAVASGGARGQLPSQSKKHHWRIIETKIRIWTFWEFRYGVVWFPLKNHYLD